jgi:poly(ADP-ribose) glycohydrolase ARH3
MASPSLIERARGVLLGAFTGDALGMPFEGAPSQDVPLQLEMIEARLGRGTYTDDTEMMIVLAEHLAQHGTVDAGHLAEAFLTRHDPNRGYGKGTLTVFGYWRQGVPVDVAAARLFGGKGSVGNGAAMRIAPVGIRFASKPRRLRDEAKRSAAVTHAHRLGIDAALAQAVAVAAAMRGEPIVGAVTSAVETDEMRHQLAMVEDLLGDRRVEPAGVARLLGNTAEGPRSVPAAIYAACRANDFRGAVTFAVRCGGDTDTIGAMAGAIAGARHGVAAIPHEWLDALEDGPRGRSYVERLAIALATE